MHSCVNPQIILREINLLEILVFFISFCSVHCFTINGYMLPARSVGNKNLKFRGDITSFKAHKGKRVRDEYVCIVEKKAAEAFQY